MSKQLYANVNPSSRYAHQATKQPFPIQLESDPHQIADGYLFAGGPGGSYRLEDLEFYHKRSEAEWQKLFAYVPEQDSKCTSALSADAKFARGAAMLRQAGWLNKNHKLEK